MNPSQWFKTLVFNPQGSSSAKDECDLVDEPKRRGYKQAIVKAIKYFIGRL